MSVDPFYGGLPSGEAPEARRVVPGEEVEPVELEITRACEYKRKPCGTCGRPKSNPVHRVKGGSCMFKRQLGCARCGKAKGDAVHYGAPETFNLVAGRDPNVYRSVIEGWKKVLIPRLEASGLPLGLGHVLVEGEVSFGDQRERDQGNHRVLIEKAVGDALVERGWLASDSWSHYEFGGLARRDEPGVSRLRLMLFASAPRPAAPDVQGSLL